MQIEKIKNTKWRYKYNESYYYIEINDLLAHWLYKIPNTQNNNGSIIINGIKIEKILEHLIKEDTTRNYCFTESDLLQFKIAIQQLEI